MATTRLNEAIRGATIKALEDKRFTPQFDKIEKRKTQLGDDLYEHMYGEVKLRMARLPQGWLSETNDISCYVEGHWVRLEMSRKRRFPDSHKKMTLSNTSVLGSQWVKIQADERALYDTRGEAMRNARAVLASCRTVEALLKAWPEVKPLLPANLSNPPVVCSALAIPMETLNQILGLS